MTYRIFLEIILDADDQDVRYKIAEFYAELEKLDRDVYIATQKIEKEG